MRIEFRIRVGVVHPVHDGVGARAQVRRALCEPRKDVKELFPALAHRKCPVRRKAMLEESLRKQGEIPVCNKENKDWQERRFLKMNEPAAKVWLIYVKGMVRGLFLCNARVTP
jgi:hypothetical protein